MLRILLTGASGFVGSQVGIHLGRLGHTVLGVTFTSQNALPFKSIRLDLCDHGATIQALDGFRPNVILHAAAQSRVLDCEDHPESAMRVNVESTRTLAEWSAEHAARMIFVSTDQVFRGDRGNYQESDVPDPINQYGRSKAAAERIVAGASDRNLIVRSNSVVGPSIGWGSSFSDRMLVTLRRNEAIDLFSDQYRSPIHIRRMIEVLSAVVDSGTQGILHAGGPERQSRLDTVTALAKAYGIPMELLQTGSYLDHPRADAMHPDGSFDVSKLRSLFPNIEWPTLDEEFRTDAQKKEAIH